MSSCPEWSKFDQCGMIYNKNEGNFRFEGISHDPCSLELSINDSNFSILSKANCTVSVLQQMQGPLWVLIPWAFRNQFFEVRISDCYKIESSKPYLNTNIIYIIPA